MTVTELKTAIAYYLIAMAAAAFWQQLLILTLPLIYIVVCVFKK